MNRLYNIEATPGWLQRKARSLGLLSLVIALNVAAISCRKAAPVNENRVVERPTAEAIAEAEQLYAARGDLTKVRRGVVALRQAQAADPTNYELAWRLAKFNYYVGAHSSDSNERDKAFRDGIEAGKLAVKLQDGKPEGHFWLGANYGGSAEWSTLAGLADIEDIKQEMAVVLNLNEEYESGSAYMVLGQVYLESPRLLGGDSQKAIEYLEKGLRLGPNNALLRWHLAEAYAQVHRNEDARKQIDALLAMKPAPGYEPEYDEAAVQARKLQDKIK